MKIFCERGKWMELGLERIRLLAVREIVREHGRWL